MSILRLSKVVLAILSQRCSDLLNPVGEPTTQEGSSSSSSIASAEFLARVGASPLSQHTGAAACLNAHSITRDMEPDEEVFRALVRLAWASCNGDYHLMLTTSWEDLSLVQLPSGTAQVDENEYADDTQLCKYGNTPSRFPHRLVLLFELVCIFVHREALEVLKIVNILTPKTLLRVSEGPTFRRFFLEMILLCPTKALRMSAAEQFLLIATNGPRPESSRSDPPSMLSYFLDLLFSVLHNTVPENAKNSQEFFQLLCRLINFAANSNACLPTAESLLPNEIGWLKKARVCRLLLCTSHRSSMLKRCI